MMATDELVLKVLDEPVSPTVYQSILDGLCLSWPQHERRFRSKGRTLNGCHPNKTIVVFDGDKVVAHVGIHFTTVSVSKQRFSVCGVQQLFALPEYAFRGLTKSNLVPSKQVLNEALKVGMEHGCDFAMGFARDRVTLLHKSMGWGCFEHDSETCIVYMPLKDFDFPTGTVVYERRW